MISGQERVYRPAMRALTVLQPYAEQIASGRRVIENRTWFAPDWAIGHRIAIHAGRSRRLVLPGDPEDLVFGAIVATATLVGCWTRCTLLAGRVPHMRWVIDRPDFEGPVCWILADVQRVMPPVPCRGHHRLWPLPAEIEAAVLSSIDQEDTRCPD